MNISISNTFSNTFSSTISLVEISISQCHSNVTPPLTCGLRPINPPEIDKHKILPLLMPKRK